MNLPEVINQLEAGATTIAALTRGVTPEQASWKPSPDAWSIVEVINHLYDEEREDFRQRVYLPLLEPGQPIPSIDPEGWVVERDYNSRDLSESLANFLDERRSSIQWLRELGDERWDTHLNHPHFNDLRAVDILYSWAAHDLLHIRQLNELHYAYLRTQAGSYIIGYAGDW
jgi:hypothetical protein